MSSILPIGSQAVSYAYGGGSTSSDTQSSLGGIAGMLSMSPTDLQSSLKSGKSISDVASAKGVSTDSITQYVEQQIQQQRSASGQPPLSSQAVTQAANKVVGGHHHGGHHHHGGGAAPAASTSSSSTSTSATDSIWSSPDGTAQSTLDLLA
jgi:hypothetical protein